MTLRRLNRQHGGSVCMHREKDDLDYSDGEA